MARLRVIDLRESFDDPTTHLPRPKVDLAAAMDGVEATMTAVAERGDAAVAELTERFDGVSVGLDSLVPQSVIDEALIGLAPDLRAALERAIDQVRWFHEHAKPKDWSAQRGTAAMGQWHRPVGRVGVYVPGGKAVYPSTVVMTVVPAQVAGVEEIILCTPPTGQDGWPNRTILAAAALLGVSKVHRVGGAQAVAAMAFGTASIPACDKVVGPGNIFVALAKQRASALGLCGIDAVAGPTEIAIVADRTANPRFLAADLVAQAEHDEMATCLLITDDAELLAPVEAALEEEIAGTKHSDRVSVALKGQGAVALVRDMDQAVAVAEAFAAEHLEVHTENSRAVAERIRYAGTTFIGASTPVSLGDYAAGPNHTLPTSGTARFNGGLTTASYMVPVNWVEYDHDALAELAPSVLSLSEAEDLPAHGRAVQVRLDDPPESAS